MSGLVTMKPDECSCWGGNIWITDNGGVRFENATEVSLNNVFTGDYDNYVIVLDYTSTASTWHGLRLRRDLGGGVEDDRTSSYTHQSIDVDGNNSPPASSRDSGDHWKTTVGSPTAVGQNIYLYGPYLPQPTAKRSVSVNGSASGTAGSAAFYDFAGTHSLGNSYSGITIYPSRETFTGNLIVMGYAE